MAQPNICDNKDMKNPALIFGARPETVAFLIERAWILLLYFPAGFFFFPRALKIFILLECIICNFVYLFPDINALRMGIKQKGEELKCMENWPRKDRYAFFIERVGILMVMVGFWLHNIGWIIMSYILVGIPVAMIFPLCNFMYTPWFPFLQEDKEKIQNENQIKAVPSTEKHHESIDERKSHSQSNGKESNRGSHANVVETKQPPHESILYLPKERTAQLHGDGELNHVKEKSKFDEYKCTSEMDKCISEMEARWERSRKSNQEEPKMIQKENGAEAKPSSEKHHESIKDTKAPNQSNVESKHGDHIRGSRVHVLETKQPLRGEKNVRAIFEWKPKEKQEELKKVQEENQTEAMPSSEQHHESIEERKSESESNEERPKHADQTLGANVKVVETKQPPHESIEHSANQTTAEIHGNEELKHDEENNEFDKNECTSLLPLFKEESSRLGYPQPYEMTKTQHERREFSLGNALEITFNTIYGKDLSDADLSYLELIKEVEASWERKLKTKQEKLTKAREDLKLMKEAEASWERKLKTKQEKLKKAREENKKLREEWEEERRKWGEENTSLSSALYNAQAEAASYYQMAMSNNYTYGLYA